MEMILKFTSLWLELQLRLVVFNRYLDSLDECDVCCVLFVLCSTGSRWSVAISSEKT